MSSIPVTISGRSRTRRVWATYEPRKVIELSHSFVPKANSDPEQPQSKFDSLDDAPKNKFSSHDHCRLTDFTFSARGDHIVALAYVVKGPEKEGGDIMFFEINLMQTVQAPKIRDQPPDPRASHVPPRFLLPTGTVQHRISPFRVLLESHDGATAREILAKDEMKIEDMIWKDGQWTVNVTLGTRKFVFVRKDGGAEWRGVDVSNE